MFLGLSFGCDRVAEPAPKPAATDAGHGQQAAPGSRELPILPDELAALSVALAPGADPRGIELPDLTAFARTDSDWPMLAYLVGEAQLRRGELDGALVTFSELAAWGAADAAALQGVTASGAGWGGSGLATVALWRWLQILERQGANPDAVDRVLATAAALQRTRFFAGMVRSGLLPALPLLEEDVARRLARLASAAGRPEAMSLFLDLVGIDSSGELDLPDRAIMERLIAEGLVTRERLDLFRYRRQLSLVQFAERKAAVAARLHALWLDAEAPDEVRAEAAFEWANHYRRSRSRKTEVVDALTEAYELSGGAGPVAEEALYRRAMVQGSVTPKRTDLFFADMAQLLERHPASRRADDALFAIASEQLFGAAPDLAAAFANFARLRSFRGTNEYLDSAYLVPALGLFDRGEVGDLEAADGLLLEYLARFADGPFRQRALFWRGRIAETRCDAAAAQLFRQVIEEVPFGYYGLRARLHVEFGGAARQLALPPPASATFTQLGAAHGASAVGGPVSAESPYHERLLTAEENGVYALARDQVDSIAARFGNRLDNVPLATLEEAGLFPGIAVLLALRQDAWAALDARSSADARLGLAKFLGHALGDWPLATAAVLGDAPGLRATDLEAAPAFLAAAYPAGEALPWLRAALQEAAWPIDDAGGLSRSLMYAVVRNESGFYPEAISTVGALGLFQIMPATFAQRSDCHRDTTADESVDAAAYLFDPGRSAAFWSCWVREEFQPRERNDVAYMLVRHQAGLGNFREWREAWRGRRLEDDLELQLDTLRFRATQIFVRRVLADAAIAEAADLMDDAPAVPGGVPAEGGAP